MHRHRHAVGVLPIQLAVANASPSSWEDAIISATGDGWVETVALHDERRRVFRTTAVPAIGEPVSVHLVAELLSVGAERHTARRLPR